MTTTMERDRRQEESVGPKKDGQQKVLEYLPTSLAVVTGALGTVGGLTGGIARMLRNHPGLAMLVLGAGVLAMVLALLARLLSGSAAGRVLTAALICFAGSLFGGTVLAVDSTAETDRPSLSAKLTRLEGDAAAWALVGTASASGLKSSASMQVYVYAIPVDDAEPRSQLLYVTAGPNAEGVATQSFEIPVPEDRDYRSYVVTAALGDEPRYCNGTALTVSAGLRTQTGDDKGMTACLTVRPPR